MNDHPHTPSISVVLVASAEGDDPRACLNHLAAQREAGHVEVVLVDQRRLPTTASVLRAGVPAPLPFELVVLPQMPMGLAAARNLGAETARGQWILFLRLDGRLAPEALAKLEGFVREYPSEVAVQLRLESPGTHRVGRLEALRLDSQGQTPCVEEGHLLYAHGSGLVLHRSLLEEGRLFDPAYPRAQGAALVTRLARAGRPPALVRDARLATDPGTSLLRYLGRRFAAGYRAAAERRSLGVTQRWSTPLSGDLALCRVHGPGLVPWVVLSHLLRRLGLVTHALVGLHPGRRPVLSAVVDPVREQELMARLIGAARRRESLAVTYLTAWTLVHAHRGAGFARMLPRFDLVYADGMGVVLSLLLTRTARCKKVTAAAFFLELCREAAQRELSVALVGARPGVVKRLAARLERDVPGLDLVAVRDGYFEGREREELLGELRERRPHLVVLGMGQPLQERVALELWGGLEGTVVWCVGGLFDLLAGETPEPRAWVRRFGFEWLHRLLTRPQRMWVRYVIGLPYLAWLLVRDPFVRVVHRIRGAVGDPERAGRTGEVARDPLADRGRP